jgi:hypothetical protein
MNPAERRLAVAVERDGPKAGSPTGVLDLQQQALLERVRATAAETVAAVEWDTDAQVETLRRDARSEAHAQVRAAARAKRERVAASCRRAMAEAETRDRTRAFEREHDLATRALSALPAALADRWHDPAARLAWCRAAAAVAARRLVARDWSVALAPGAADADREAITQAAVACGAAVCFAPATDVPAGLRLAAGAVTVDATPDGLLADRATVESLVLADRATRETRAPGSGEKLGSRVLAPPAPRGAS